MRVFVYIAIVVCTLDVVTSVVPDVYEFCNALLSNGRPEGGCDVTCPQGPPGLPGPEGKAGPPGPKGNDSASDTLNARIDRLENKLNKVIRNNPDNFVDLCGLGMKSNAIPDSAITVTSQWDGGWTGRMGRLDHASRCWHARPSEVGQYIQIDFGKPTTITGVVTQGRPNVDQWVISYKIACVDEQEAVTWSMENGEEKVFAGNTDQSSKIVQFLPTAMSCRYVRLYPQEWKNEICMRMELLGEDCRDFME